MILTDQSSLDTFIVKAKKQPPVTKSILEEFLLEVIVNVDLVSLQSTKCTLLHSLTMLQSGDDLDDEYGENFDVETCMEAEAGPTQADAILEAYSTDFIAVDAVGKLMAFISQIQASGEVTQDYLHELCNSNNCPAWEIKLWIHTHWGSLSDCFHVVLGVQ